MPWRCLRVDLLMRKQDLYDTIMEEKRIDIFFVYSYIDAHISVKMADKPISLHTEVADRMRRNPFFNPFLHSKARRRTIFYPLALSVAMAAMLIFFQPEVVHANVVDKVKQWFELPGQVNDLREQYDTTKQRLKEATKQFDEAAQQSQEAIKQIEQYRQSEQQLREENERLIARNEQLAQAISSLQDAEQERADRTRRTWTLIWSAAALVGLYFMSARLFRLLLRSKHS